LEDGEEYIVSGWLLKSQQHVDDGAYKVSVGDPPVGNTFIGLIDLGTFDDAVSSSEWVLREFEFTAPAGTAGKTVLVFTPTPVADNLYPGLDLVSLRKFEGCVEACPDDQIIMRLSSSSNAHGALWDQSGTGHDVKICYDEIFPGSGNGSHDCAGLNLLLSLSAQSNAHASDTPDPILYPEDVCYGDLACSVRSTGCIGGEICVVTMSASDNAHLAECPPPSASWLSVCCDPSGGGPLPVLQSITGLTASNILEGDDTTVVVSLARPEVTDVTLTFYNALDASGTVIHTADLDDVSGSRSLNDYGATLSEGVYKVVAEIPGPDCRICAKTQTFTVTKPFQSASIPETGLVGVIAVGLLVVLFVSSRKH